MKSGKKILYVSQAHFSENDVGRLFIINFIKEMLIKMPGVITKTIYIKIIINLLIHDSFCT